MATDFRFNGQTSYSPLLSALAEAPQNAAKLAILKEQNTRQRLSDLLTNMSNAASLARNIQLIHQGNNQIAGEEGVTKIATQSNPLAGAVSAANPEAFSAGLSSVQAPFMGLDTMMGGGQPPQPSASAAPPLAQGEGGLPGATQSQAPQSSPSIPMQSEGVQDPRKAIIMNKLFPSQYQLSTDPNNGLQRLVSSIPGMPIIPVDKPQTQNLITDPKDLNPIQIKALPEFADKFATDSKPEQEVLLNTKEFKGLAASKNPISDTTLKLLAPRLTGIVARINPTTLDAYGGSSAVVDKINSSLERAKNGKLTDKDRSFLVNLANNVESTANDALKQKLGDAVSKAQVSIRGVDPGLLAKAIGGNTQDRINSYKPISGSQSPKVPASARFKQLTGKGISKQAAYTQMHDEGY